MCSIEYLIVDDNVNDSVSCEVVEITQVHALIHDTLPRERCITMKQDAHGLKNNNNNNNT